MHNTRISKSQFKHFYNKKLQTDTVIYFMFLLKQLNFIYYSQDN